MRALIILLLTIWSLSAVGKGYYTDQNKTTHQYSDNPIFMTCYSSGKEVFTIRRKTNDRLKIGTLVFPDDDGIIGSLHRDGINWRFNWYIDGDLGYSIIIRSNEIGYYYDFTDSESKEIVQPRESFSCKRQQINQSS